MTVREIANLIEAFAPLSLAADYDNTGLICGDYTAKATGVMVSLDASETVIAECVANKCNVLITHHPLIFGGIKSVTSGDYCGRTLISAIKGGVNVYAAHTNTDAAEGGNNDTFAQLIGLKNTYKPCYEPYAVIGDAPENTTLKDLVEAVRAVTGGDIRCVGDMAKAYGKVCVISGAGGRDEDLLLKLKADGCSALITAEVKYSVALRFKNEGAAIIECNHYDNEKIFCDIIVRLLSASRAGKEIKVVAYGKNASPYNGYKPE